MTGEPDGSTPVPDAGPDATVDSGPSDPCEGVDEDDRCDEESAACDGDTLVACQENDDGCLVITRTDCTGGNNDFCDETASPPECAQCADLDGACDEAGTRCEGLNLVTCAANADGCLVDTETDCTDGTNNYCALTGTDAACAYDNCRDDEGVRKEEVCVIDATMCAEEVLVECIDDADGCPIAEQTDCTTATGFNHCDETAATPACAFAPCLGVTQCLAAGAGCDGTDVVTCAANGAGCLIETREDCTDAGTTSERCDAADGSPSCVPCMPDPGCETALEGAVDCNGNTFELCSDTDSDQCLNLVRESCGPQFTCVADAAVRCDFTAAPTCDSDVTLELRVPGSFGSFSTTGAGNHYNNYTCPGIGEIFPFVAQGPDLLFSLDVPAGSVGTVTLTNPTGFGANPAYLMVLASCDDAAATAESTCTTVSATTVSHTNESSATVRVYIAVDADGAGTVGTFGLEVGVHPLGCGDGILDGSEECDDANIFPEDGCTPACTLEEGFECTTASPSICTSRPEEPICGNVMCPPLPAGAIGGNEVCCTPQQRCGLAYPLLFGAGCIERDQDGVDDEDCPDEPSIIAPLLPTLLGCCRSDDTCGLQTTDDSGVGCVERSELWRTMSDGFGALFYTGPFERESCGAD